MKNENEFNAYLKKEFKKHPKFKAVKISDRFKIGLPDWLLFHEGRAVVIESKWAKTCEKDTNILGHTLSKPQVTSLKGFSTVGVPSVVLIGIEDTRVMAVGCFSLFNHAGNLRGDTVRERFVMFDMGDTYGLLKYLFVTAPYVGE